MGERMETPSLSKTNPREKNLVVHDNDVLSGRGVNIAHHPGNERFRTLITSRKDEAYCTTYSACEKRAIALEIIKHIQSLDPPGRFLKREGRGHVSRGLNGPWDELSERECIKKTCQALRDCNRSDRVGYAIGVPPPEDVVQHTAKRVATGLTGKEQAEAAAAAASITAPTVLSASISLKRSHESLAATPIFKKDLRNRNSTKLKSLPVSQVHDTANSTLNGKTNSNQSYYPESNGVLDSKNNISDGGTSNHLFSNESSTSFDVVAANASKMHAPNVDWMKNRVLEENTTQKMNSGAFHHNYPTIPSEHPIMNKKNYINMSNNDAGTNGRVDVNVTLGGNMNVSMGNSHPNTNTGAGINVTLESDVNSNGNQNIPKPILFSNPMQPSPTPTYNMCSVPGNTGISRDGMFVSSPSINGGNLYGSSSNFIVGAPLETPLICMAPQTRPIPLAMPISSGIQASQNALLNGSSNLIHESKMNTNNSQMGSMTQPLTTNVNYNIDGSINLQQNNESQIPVGSYNPNLQNPLIENTNKSETTLDPSFGEGLIGGTQHHYTNFTSTYSDPKYDSIISDF